MEVERIDRLPSWLELKSMGPGLDDSDNERECFKCFYDLYLSAVTCQCSPNRFTCLKHAKLSCSCDEDERFALLRYDLKELKLLVEALEGGHEALKEWISRDPVSLKKEEPFSSELVQSDFQQGKSQETVISYGSLLGKDMEKPNIDLNSVESIKGENGLFGGDCKLFGFDLSCHDQGSLEQKSHGSLNSEDRGSSEEKSSLTGSGCYIKRNPH